MAHHLIYKGVDFDYENKQSSNKLLTAVMDEDEKNVRRLLKGNWSPNSTNNQGYTAVHLAARSASLYNILKLLLDSGGLPDHVTHSGVTPLSLAVHFGIDKNVSLLLDRGASVNVTNSFEVTPLHHACCSHNLEIVKLLTEAGAEINASDFTNVTPLMNAVRNEQHSIVSYLLENGADVLMKDDDERTVFHYADSLELFNILLERYPNPTLIGDLADSEGWTLLMYTAQMGNVRIVDRLLELGSDPSKRNNKGLIALHLAAHNSFECFKSLLDKTPTNVINALCIHSPENYTNSLPCLIINSFNIDSLKLLFNQPGIDNRVLLCPVLKEETYYLPVAFSFGVDTDNFTLAVIQMYVNRGLPLDTYPEFPHLTVTCVESLIASHMFHTRSRRGYNDFKKPCGCAKLLVTLLENSASADPYRTKSLRANNFLMFVCVNGSTFGLSYLLRYSNFLEPHCILRFFTKFIIETELLDSLEQISKTIEFLCKYSRPWDVFECKDLMNAESSTHPAIDTIVASYQLGNTPVPSLRFLCRAAIREGGHDVLMPDLPNVPFYSFKAGKAFRQFLTNLPLPKSLLAYLQYDDMITDLKYHSNYPSFYI